MAHYQKLAMLGVAAISLMVPSAFGEVIYENDFATRTSAGVVPMSEWRTYNYLVDYIANTNGAAPFTEKNNVMQDGWIKIADDTNHNVYCENAHVWAGVSGTDNPAVVLGRKAAVNASSCVVKQRLGNTFTNGTLTAQFDFMPPGQWASYGDADTLRRVNLSFGDEGFYSPDVSQSKIYQHTVGSVGVAIHGPSGSRQRKVWYNDNIDCANSNMTEQVVTRFAWHRAVVTIDLDAREWGFSMYEMGTSQPAMDAPTPATPVYTASNLPFVDDSVTSISSIAIVGVGVCWDSNSYNSSTTPTYVAWFDNIRISHNGELCYENDFATRRWRTFGGTASHTYVADCLVTNSVEKDVYVVDRNLVPARENDGTTIQPEGIDRWRRVNKDGTGLAAIKSDSSGNFLRFDLSRDGTKKNFYAFLAQPLETTFSSGKLKFSVDTRLPSGNYWKYQSGFASVLWVTLGSASYYAGDPNKYNGYRWAAVGIRAQGDGNKVTYVPTSGDSPNFLPDTGSITNTAWYRIVIEADIDAKNYAFKVYSQGAINPQINTADGTLIYTSQTIARKDSIQTISSFSLAAYYCPVYFDNIKIWHTPTGSESETLLYSNNFTTRTIYAQDTRVAQLVGRLKLNPEGQDHWTRAYNNDKGIFVDWADNNPALTFARDGSDMWAVQDIGQTVKSGLLVAQADMKPPKGWLANGGSTYVRLGGDALRQSPMRKDDSYFLNNIAMGFGFKNTNTGKSDNLYTNSTIAAFRGDLHAGGAMENAEFDVDTTHWYRFVATTAVTRNQYDVSVYDMGTEHPTLATPTPTNEPPVATFSALPFRRTKAVLGGISCISVSGNKAAQNMYDQSLEPMIDNLRVSHTMFGTRISIK